MKTVVVSGARLAVLDEGHGPPLLLVHGFPLDHALWNAQVAAFSPRYRVIAPDLRGFGGSDATPGTVHMQQFADDLDALLGALKVVEPVHFCGLSMGGYIAWQFWLKYAPRLRSLVLCDTRAAADSREAARGRAVMADQAMHDSLEPIVAAMLPKLLAPQTFAQRPAVADAVRAMILRTPPQGIAAALRGMAARPDMTSHLGQIRVPALAIVGEHDAISTPAEMRGIAAAIPGCSLAEIPAAGHLTPMEAPEALNAALGSFLTGH